MQNNGEILQTVFKICKEVFGINPFFIISDLNWDLLTLYRCFLIPFNKKFVCLISCNLYGRNAGAGFIKDIFLIGF